MPWFRRQSREDAPIESAPTTSEVRLATGVEIEELGLLVSAAWNSVKQGNHSLREDLDVTEDGDTVRIRQTPTDRLSLVYTEVALTPNSGATLFWTVTSTTTQPHMGPEVPQGFDRTKTTYQLVEGGVCTLETAICSPDDKHVLQPIPNTVATQNLGPITDLQVGGLSATLRSIGVDIGTQTAA